MKNRTYVVQATWDNEAKMWVAESDDIPGVAAEAEDQETLRSKLASLIPEMIELNNVPVDRTQPLDVVIRYSREDRISLPLAA
jgi:predicted RNase H-like HicB family nuclease